MPLIDRLNPVVSGVLSRVDAWERTPSRAPSPAEDLSPVRVEPGRWDLRTLIAVFGPEAPLRYLNLNFAVGLTGLPFDRPEHLGAVPAGQAFDLQVCLEGRGLHAAHKAYHPRAAYPARRSPGGVELPPLLSFEGTWPDYRAELCLPHEALTLELELRSREGLCWWARNPGLYSHYTSFASARLRWRWGREEGALETPLLHDHGWGRNLGVLGRGLQLFRYEVLRLPGDAYLVVLVCDGPGGVHLRRTALHRRLEGPGHRLKLRSFEVLEWETLPNYRGAPRRLPRRWRTRLRDEAGRELILHGALAEEARPLLGDGFLAAQDYQAEGALLETLGHTGALEGEGYVEQMGNP
ncbi:MAG: hypothetical protein P1V51_03775 [Deltaproteobacteria bacterium]|nr:hypothetical protein [Deltaproteobacteria bacterium]